MSKQNIEGSVGLASAAWLMANPAGGAIVLSALGMGLASQMLGAWMGAASAAAELSHRYWSGNVAGADALEPSLDPSGHRSNVVALHPDRKAGVSGDNPSPKRSAPREMPAMPATAPAAHRFEENRRPVAPARPDDLKRISGIGPKLESILNGFGIRSFAQIAAWTPDDVGRMDERLGVNGRIVRDEWIEQAAALAVGGRKAPGTGNG